MNKLNPRLTMSGTIYYVYITECADGTFYIGITTNLFKRISMHNGFLKGGAKYTRMRRPVILRYNEKLIGRSEATKRELSLKKLTHNQKMSLCDAYTCKIIFAKI